MRNKKYLKRVLTAALAGILVFSNVIPALANTIGTSEEEAVPARVLDMSFDSNLNDASELGNNGTAVGEAQYVEGIKGEAFKFNGSTYINMGTDASLNPASLSVSFWIKPTQSISSEEIILWNKNRYDSDGWYITIESTSQPLNISIGESNLNGQPYKVGAIGNTADFYPVNEWTHIAITFDDETKDVNIYRNGIRQSTTVHYPIGSSGATGTILPDNNMQKSLGYNGPTHRGAYAKFAMDELVILDQAVSQADVIGLYEEAVPFDYSIFVDADLDSLVIPETTRSNLTLPAKGENGSEITWVSKTPSVLANDGTIAAVTEAAEVELEATVKYENVTKTKTFYVTVLPKAVSFENNGMDKVTLLDDYLNNATDKDVEYLLSMSSEKFLYEFYKVSGLEPTTDSGYEGWEANTSAHQTFRGHFFGHYMSALSQAYLGSVDADTKAELLEQIVAAVEGLDKCQKAYAIKDPQNAGYVSAFDEDVLTYAEAGTNGHKGVLVGYYNIHKVLQGLIDIAKNVGGDIGGEALDIAEYLGTHFYNRLSRLSTMQLNVEYGGMNDSLYELYKLTGNEKFKIAAQYFDETSLFNALNAGGSAATNAVKNKHANTMIPKFTGALNRYTVLSENDTHMTGTEKAELESYFTAAVNFWDLVMDQHTYVTGGNSAAEAFREPYQLASEAAGGRGDRTCETCNTYNMLKLSRRLFELTHDKKYLDYYENTFINAILASQNPNTGMMMYFQPMSSGYHKVYNQPYTHFWCCTGTGIESFTKLEDSIYFDEGDDFYVNMYFSSTYEDNGLKLTQEANMPNEEMVTLTVEEMRAGLKLRLREPDWIADDVTLKINGDITDVTYDENGFILIEGLVSQDKIEITFPMEVTVHDLPDDSNMVAFKYGPVVLSTSFGSENVGNEGNDGVIVRKSTRDSNVPTSLYLLSQTVENWKANATENVVRIEDTEDGEVQFKLNGVNGDYIYTPYYSMHEQTYGLYMILAESDSAEAQKALLQEKQATRNSETQTDFLSEFDDHGYEANFNLQKSDDSGTGAHNGRQYRDAKAGGWFSYTMPIDPDAETNYLLITYTSDDSGRSFDIYINDKKYVTEKVLSTSEYTDEVNAMESGFYTIRRAIPEELYAKEDGEITIRFQSTGGLVGGIYGIGTGVDYDTNPDLADISFDTGTLAPAFSSNTVSYTLTLLEDTDTVMMSITADEEIQSKLVYYKDSNDIDTILIDDRIEREISVTEDETVVTLTAKAQDHTTEKVYTITIVRGEEDPELATAEDKAFLKMSIDYALELQSKYPEYIIKEVKENFENALKNAQAVYANGAATKKQVQDADELLIKAIHYLSFTANYDKLEDAIDDAYDVINSGLYEDDAAMDAYKKIVNELEEMLLYKEVTDTEINEKLDELDKAFDNLNEKQDPGIEVDVTRLQREVNKAKSFYENIEIFYDDEARAAFKAAYEYAVEIIADKEAYTQEQVDQAAIDLHNAMLALRIVPSKDALAALLTEGYDIDPALFTEVSYAVLAEALAFGQIIFDKADATEAEIAEACDLIKAAIIQLDPVTEGPSPIKPDKTELKQLLDYVKALTKADYTEESFANIIEAVAYAWPVYLDEDATEEAVAKAVELLKEAIANLVKAGEKPGQTDDTDSTDDTGDTNEPGQSGTDGPGGAGNSGKGSGAKTGDTASAAILFAMLAMSLFLGAVVLHRQKKA